MVYIFWILAHEYIRLYFSVIDFSHFYFLLNIYIIDAQNFLSHFIQHARSFIDLDTNTI